MYRYLACFALIAPIITACTEEVMPMEGPTGPVDYATDFDELPTREWTEIVTDIGGCVRGGKYSFWVNPGDPSKVLFEFAGGGACWNELTCGVEANLFDASLEDDRQDFASVRPPGIRNHDNIRNPFRDWTHVFIPYCTGDVHAGDNEFVYGSTTAQHRGGVNTRAVLEWAERANLPTEQLLVGGCSAGGYASAVWSPTIFDMYPEATKTQLNDSATGIVGPALGPEVFAQWRMDGSIPLPDWAASAPDGATSIVELLANVYGATAERYPDSIIAHYTSPEDFGQKTILGLSGGGTGNDFNELQLEAMRAYRDAAPNYRYNVVGGFGHCALENSGYYADRTQGVFFRDWLAGLVARTTEQDLVCSECAPL